MRTLVEQKQRLGIALGLARKDGTAYVVGSQYAPQTTRLSAALVRMGYRWGRLSRGEAEDIGFVGSSPGEGEAGHHWADGALPPEIITILTESIQGPDTVDGPATLEWYVHQIRCEYYTPDRIRELLDS